SLLGIATAGAGGMLARASGPALVPVARAVPAPELPEVTNADPVVGNTIDYPAEEPADPPRDETRLRRQLEERVWGGRGSVAAARMPRATARHQSDRAGGERARAALDRARGSLR